MYYRIITQTIQNNFDRGVIVPMCRGSKILTILDGTDINHYTLVVQERVLLPSEVPELDRWDFRAYAGGHDFDPTYESFVGIVNATRNSPYSVFVRGYNV